MAWLLNAGPTVDVWERGALGQVGLPGKSFWRRSAWGRGLKEMQAEGAMSSCQEDWYEQSQMWETAGGG